MIITFDHADRIAENISMLWFKPERKLDYIAGQFIEMTLPHDQPDDRGQRRWFTLTSSPTEDMLAITTKHAVERMSTFKQTLFNLQPGATVHISEPMGDFVLPKDTNIPLTFVAGGIGVTPVRSIVKWLSDTSQKRQIQIIYSVLSEDEIVFKDSLANSGSLNIFLSGPKHHLQGANILQLAGMDPSQRIYVSGPEPMTEQLEAELLNAGISASQLVLDFFPGYPNQ